MTWKNKETLGDFESSYFTLQRLQMLSSYQLEDVDAGLVVWFKQARNDSTVFKVITDKHYRLYCYSWLYSFDE